MLEQAVEKAKKEKSVTVLSRFLNKTVNSLLRPPDPFFCAASARLLQIWTKAQTLQREHPLAPVFFVELLLLEKFQGRGIPSAEDPCLPEVIRMSIAHAHDYVPEEDCAGGSTNKRSGSSGSQIKCSVGSASSKPSDARFRNGNVCR